jgi:hypothetical protein
MYKNQDSRTKTFENEIMEQFGHHFVPMKQIRYTYNQMRDPLSRDLLRDLYETRRNRLIKEAESTGAQAIADALKGREYDLQDELPTLEE